MQISFKENRMYSLRNANNLYLGLINSEVLINFKYILERKRETRAHNLQKLFSASTTYIFFINIYSKQEISLVFQNLCTQTAFFIRRLCVREHHILTGTFMSNYKN